MAITGYTAAVLEDDHDVDLLISVFRCIAEGMGWDCGDQLDVYREHSIYVGLFAPGDTGEDEKGKVVGGSQIVLPNSTLFPIETSWPEIILRDRTDVCDFALTAIEPNHRGLHLHWLVHAEAWRALHHIGISHVYIEATRRSLRAYNRFGLPFDVIGPERMHWGEMTLPCHAMLEDIYSEVEGRASRGSSLHQLAIDTATDR